MDAERHALLDRLVTFPGRLGVAARRAEAADGPGGPPPGEWTAREAVAHLVAVEAAVWQARLDQLSSGGLEPGWAWTEPGPVTDPAAARLEGAIALFAASREATVARLEALDDSGWARAGIHAVYGRLDVAGLLRVAAEHDEEHLVALEARAGATP